MMHPELKLKLLTLAKGDVTTLEAKGAAYGDNWKRRGGVGAFMMLARKWDRIENVTKSFNWDIFSAALSNGEADAEGVLDDIADLRRYLLLVESEVHALQMNPHSVGAMRELMRTLEEERQCMADHAASIRSQGAR